MKTISSTRRLASWLIWPAVVVLLVGCGFHLRGAGPGELPAIYIEGGTPGGGVRGEMERILRGSGQSVATAADRAQAVIIITREDLGKRVLSVSSNATVSEYGLDYTVGFRVVKPSGAPIGAPQQFTLSRDYTFDATQVLGKGSEEDLLRQEMVRDAARQVLVQVQTLTAHEASP